MRLRIVLVLIGVLVFAGPPALASTFPDLPGMKAADRVVGGRAPSSLSTGTSSSGTRTQKASAPASTSSEAAAVSKTVNLPNTKSIRALPGAGVLPVFNAAAHHPLALPLGLVLLATFVCIGWTKLLYALNRI